MLSVRHRRVDFSRPDSIDSEAFNRVLWKGVVDANLIRIEAAAETLVRAVRTTKLINMAPMHSHMQNRCSSGTGTFRGSWHPDAVVTAGVPLRVALERRVTVKRSASRCGNG